jgi:hypothetical protein
VEGGVGRPHNAVWDESSEKGWLGMVESKCKSLFLRKGGLPSFLQGLQYRLP